MSLGYEHKKTFNEINITPLTDIFLVLLIIMMVVAPMMQQLRGDITPPEINSGSSIEPGKVTVEVTQEGDFYVMGEPTTESELTSKLSSYIDQVEEKNVVIRADKTTRSGVVMKILEAARDAEYEKVTVAGESLSSDRQQELESGSSAGLNVLEN